MFFTATFIVSLLVSQLIFIVTKWWGFQLSLFVGLLALITLCISNNFIGYIIVKTTEPFMLLLYYAILYSVPLAVLLAISWFIRKASMATSIVVALSLATINTVFFLFSALSLSCILELGCV